jgi:carbonic anhydrase
LGCLKEYKKKKYAKTKSTETENPYLDQEAWKTYPNYYSVLKTPININSKQVIKTCDNNICIKYNKDSLCTVTESEGVPKIYPNLSNNYVIHNDNIYTLINFHFHNSSENTIDNEYNPVEVHFVNEYIDPLTNEPSYLVLGLLLKLTNGPGLEITNIDYKSISEDLEYEYEKIFDLSIFNKLTKNPYYKFIGSLTVPPFNQNFNWNLFDHRLTEKIPLSINYDVYSDFVYYFINNKANNQSDYNKSRYIAEKNNFLVVKLVTKH